MPLSLYLASSCLSTVSLRAEKCSFAWAVSSVCPGLRHTTPNLSQSSPCLWSVWKTSRCVDCNRTRVWLWCVKLLCVLSSCWDEWLISPVELSWSSEERWPTWLTDSQLRFPSTRDMIINSTWNTQNTVAMATNTSPSSPDPVIVLASAICLLECIKKYQLK